MSVIGAGLAGSEAAWQLAERGLPVRLFDMKPERLSPAHASEDFAELVCSNSLRANTLGNAVGLLKEEMRRLGSLVLRAAEATAVPAGKALAVDRVRFSRTITEAIEGHPLIEIVRERVVKVPDDRPVILATGPLTDGDLAADLGRVLGEEYLYFYDAISPTIYKDSIDESIVFRASRYDTGDEAEGDYLNVPLSRDEYEALVDALCSRKLCDPVFVDCLELQKTGVGTRGIEKLVAPMWGGGLRIKTLFLNDCCLDDDAVQTLVQALGQAWLDHDHRGYIKPLRKDGIRTLDLSGNSFGERGMTALLDTRWSQHLRSLYVCALRGVPKRCYVELCRQVREGIYPKIELIMADTGNTRSKQVPIEEAVAYWDWQRKLRANADEWERYQKEFKKEEAQKKKARDATRARNALAVVDTVLGFNVASQV